MHVSVASVVFISHDALLWLHDSLLNARTVKFLKKPHNSDNIHTHLQFVSPQDALCCVLPKALHFLEPFDDTVNRQQAEYHQLLLKLFYIQVV